MAGSWSRPGRYGSSVGNSEGRPRNSCRCPRLSCFRRWGRRKANGCITEFDKAGREKTGTSRVSLPGRTADSPVVWIKRKRLQICSLRFDAA